MNPEIAFELRTLAANYADAVDQRDRELLLSAFHPDATLEIIRPAGDHAGPTTVMRGHDQIGRIVTAITKYRQTFHMLGQSTYLRTADGASGLVACIAHHRWTDTEELDHIIAEENLNLHIADQLHISERTVETHRKNIFTKTGCKSVVGLLQYALRHKLLKL